MALYLENARFHDFRTGQIIEGNIVVPEQPGKSLEFVTRAARAGEQVVDCREYLIVRGLLCAHHHAYSALARGMPPPSQAVNGFPQILERIWWVLDRALDPESISASALATALACAKNGVTCVIDHHSSPTAIPGSLDLIAAAFRRVGIGYLLCYELSDRDGPRAAQQGLEETERYLATGQPGLVGLHASCTVGPDLLREAVSLSRRFNTGLHVHLAEDVFDQEQTLARYGKRAALRLAEAGVLDHPATILVHCLHLDPEERRLIREAPCWVARNPESNQNNGVGRFHGSSLGDRILLGTDGMHSDMLQSLRAAFLQDQASGGTTAAAAHALLRRAHSYLQQNRFPGDGEHNLLLLDYPSPTPVTADNFPAHLAYGIQGRHVSGVIAGGTLIMYQGRFTALDEQALLADCRKSAAGLWQRMANMEHTYHTDTGETA